VQISGGEPTLHPDFFAVLDAARRRPIRHLMINTNGVRIAQDPAFVERLASYAPRLEVYLQFDSLRDEALMDLRGARLARIRQQALEALERVGLSTTLVCVVKRGVNDGEVAEIVRHALEWRCVRGVTFQPVQDAGRNEGFDPAENRVLLSLGDRAYARGQYGDAGNLTEEALTLGAGKSITYRVFRNAVPLKDPGTGEVLAYEAQYVGKAEIVRPETRREIEEPVAGALPIDPAVPVLLIEGNYLLLDDPAWAGVRPLLDACWWVGVDDALRVARLVRRHEQFGRSAQAAREWVERSDEANARRIQASAHRADWVVRWPAGGSPPPDDGDGAGA